MVDLPASYVSFREGICSHEPRKIPWKWRLVSFFLGGMTILPSYVRGYFISHEIRIPSLTNQDWHQILGVETQPMNPMGFPFFLLKNGGKKGEH